jgi:hypothetical protein
MDTMILDRDAIPGEAPTGILTHDPRLAEPGAERVWPEVSGPATPTYLHPLVIIAAASGYGWFLLVFWIAFAGYGYMTAAMTVATLISGTMLGLMAAGGAGGRNMEPWRRPWRSFREFLTGEVEVWGTRVSGWDAFVQLTAMSWLLAALATAFSVMVALDRP